jgi:hypothetical protein
LRDYSLNQQLRNPLQSPVQPQRPVRAHEIEEVTQDMATYKFWITYASQCVPSPDPPPNLKDANDKALRRFQQLCSINPGIVDQVRNAMAEHYKVLEAKISKPSHLQNANEGTHAGVGAY